MDRTELFKATVKTVRTRLRAQQREENLMGENVLSKGKKFSKFASQARKVVRKKLGKNIAVYCLGAALVITFGSRNLVQAQNITSLKQFLQEHKKDYIDPSGLADLNLLALQAAIVVVLSVPVCIV